MDVNQPLSRHTVWAIKFLHRYWENTISEHGFDGAMTLNQFRVINMLLLGVADGAPTTIKGLSDSLDMPQSTVSRVVTDLMEMGWVEHHISEDGRSRLLWFSEERLASTNAWGDFMAESALQAAQEVYEDHPIVSPILKTTEKILPHGR